MAGKGEREREKERQRCTHVSVRQTDQGSFRRVSRLLYPAGSVSVRWQSTDEALTARLYMLEEQARPSVPSLSDEPLGATTLHATIGGSTMEHLHSRSEEVMECHHESRRICRLADWPPRMCPCPAMKSRGAIRVEVHMFTVAVGVWRIDGT